MNIVSTAHGLEIVLNLIKIAQLSLQRLILDAYLVYYVFSINTPTIKHEKITLTPFKHRG